MSIPHLWLSKDQNLMWSFSLLHCLLTLSRQSLSFPLNLENDNYNDPNAKYFHDENLCFHSRLFMQWKLWTANLGPFARERARIGRSLRSLSNPKGFDHVTTLLLLSCCKCPDILTTAVSSKFFPLLLCSVVFVSLGEYCQWIGSGTIITRQATEGGRTAVLSIQSFAFCAALRWSGLQDIN